MPPKKRKKRRKNPAVMQTDMDDAKTVFDRLRFESEKAGKGRVNVDVSIFPTRDTIVAELRYSFDGTEWAAVVTKECDGVGVPVYRLWYQRGERFQKSGVFPDGERLVSYIRQAAREKFEGFTPSVDTLDNIRGRTAASLVPECYKTDQHGKLAKCQTCPYERRCFGEGDVRLGSMPAGDKEPEEPEDVFLARLRGKMKSKKWEK